jgi:hypothetical protein
LLSVKGAAEEPEEPNDGEKVLFKGELRRCGEDIPGKMKKKGGIANGRRGSANPPAAQGETSRQPPLEERLAAPVPEDLGGGFFKYCRTFPETGSLDRHPD